MSLTLISTARRLVDVATLGKDAAEARRIRTVNTSAVFGAAVSGGYVVFYIDSDEPALRPLILILVGLIIPLALIIPLNKTVNTAWRTVRRHIIWNNLRPDLKEDLAHLVQYIKRQFYVPII